MINFDFSGYTHSTKEVDPGTYVCKIEKFEGKQSSAGDPMHVVTYKILEGPQKGMGFVDYMSFKENIRWRTASLLESIGIQPEGVLSINENSIIGKRVLLTFADSTNDKYPGSTVVNFKRFSGGIQEDDEDVDVQDVDYSDEPATSASGDMDLSSIEV